MNRKSNNTNLKTHPDEGLVAIDQPKFTVVMADPPWDVNQKGSRGAAGHYDLMTLEQIKAMPVAELINDNAVCFLWITSGVKGRHAGEEVMKAWGFDYKDDLIWIKFRIGQGVFPRHSHETVLVGYKGKLPPECKNQTSWFVAPVQEHSHKPEEIYAIIERAFPSDKYLELFARKRTSHKDWYIWGNEAEGNSDIYIPGYPVPEYSDKVHLAKEDDLKEEAKP